MPRRGAACLEPGFPCHAGICGPEGVGGGPDVAVPAAAATAGIAGMTGMNGRGRPMGAAGMSLKIPARGGCWWPEVPAYSGT